MTNTTRGSLVVKTVLVKDDEELLWPCCFDCCCFCLGLGLVDPFEDIGTRIKVVALDDAQLASR